MTGEDMQNLYNLVLAFRRRQKIASPTSRFKSFLGPSIGVSDSCSQKKDFFLAAMTPRLRLPFSNPINNGIAHT